jgi:predicted kinase
MAPVMADANATREVKRIIFKIIETGLESRIEKEGTVVVDATTIGRRE